MSDVPHCCECALAEDAVKLATMEGNLTDAECELRDRAISFLKRRFDNALLPKVMQ